MPGKELFNYLEPLRSVFYVSIGCAESNCWGEDTRNIHQQNPDFMCQLAPVIHRTYILIDANIQTPSILEREQLAQPVSRVELANIPGYIVFYETQTIVVLKSNAIFTMDWTGNQYKLATHTIEFFSVLVSYIYETHSIGVVHTFTGHSLLQLRNHFKGFLTKDRIIWSITQYADYSCYVPKNALSQLKIQVDSEGSLRLITPYSIEKRDIYSMWYRLAENDPLRFQIEYVIYAKCMKRLRSIACFLEFLERKLAMGESMELVYWRQYAVSQQQNAEHMAIYNSDKLKGIQRVREYFVRKVLRVADYIPVEMSEKMAWLHHFSSYTVKPTKIVNDLANVLDEIYGIKKYSSLIMADY